MQSKQRPFVTMRMEKFTPGGWLQDLVENEPLV